MKLGQFLSGAAQAPTKAISFPVVGVNGQGVKSRATARAVFAFVDEHQRAEALRDAHAYLARLYVDKDGTPLQVPPRRRDEEETYQVLFRALRDADDPDQPFAETMLALRHALVDQVADQLARAYRKWVDEEFPDSITRDKFDELVAEAEGK